MQSIASGSSESGSGKLSPILSPLKLMHMQLFGSRNTHWRRQNTSTPSLTSSQHTLGFTSRCEGQSVSKKSGMESIL